MGLLSTKEAAQSTPLLITLPVLTIWFHLFCQGRYGPAFVTYPLQVCQMLHKILWDSCLNIYILIHNYVVCFVSVSWIAIIAIFSLMSLFTLHLLFGVFTGSYDERHTRTRKRAESELERLPSKRVCPPSFQGRQWQRQRWGNGRLEGGACDCSDETSISKKHTGTEQTEQLFKPLAARSWSGLLNLNSLIISVYFQFRGWNFCADEIVNWHEKV